MTVPEYTAGEWTAVVRPGFVALLGPQAPAATVRAIWDAADGGVVGALAVLARDGFTGLPPFALVAVEPRRVHVALRGDVEVAVGAQVLVSGAVSTWSESVVADAPGVVVRVAGAAGGAELPLAEGVVRASAVRVGLVGEDAGVEDAVAVVGDVAQDAAAPADGADDEPASVGAGYVAPEAVEHSLVALEPLEPETGEPGLPPVEQHFDAVPDYSLPADSVPADSVPADSVPADFVPVDFTLAAPPHEPAPPVVPWFPTSTAPEPAESDVVAAAEALLQAPVTIEGASPDDHDGMTIMSADLASIRDQLPAWAAEDARPVFGAPEPAPVPVGAPPRMVLSTGVVVDLDRAVLVGRAPQVSRVANHELPRLVTVPSPQQDISRTHAEVRAEGDVVLVTDLDSTNGVHVSRAGQGARRLHPGEPSVVDPGEVVDLGDGVTFTVERGT